MKDTILEDDVNVLKTAIAYECEKYLGRKMDGEGLYKYVCDALQAAKDSV